MRTALVHDWLTGYRGGERVLEILCELLPESDLYTVIHVPGSTSPRIESRRIVSSWLSRLPGVRHYYRWLLPLMPSAAAAMRLMGYDLVFAVSHSVAHGVNVAPGTRFIVYCNTPMRYAWRTLDNYFPSGQRFDPRYWALRAIRGRLREWDRRAASRATEYIANSRNVARRVNECYGRDADVIYPPVDTEYYRPMDLPKEDFYLWAGALAPYKRADLAVEAFKQLDRPLVVIGDGQDLRKVRAGAPPRIRFLGRQPDEVLRRHYATCRALIFPGEEDFGIVPLEAQACGTPVIAYGQGGALETVLDARPDSQENTATGILFTEPTAESLIEAVRRFEGIETHFSRAAARCNALRFSRDKCKEALRARIMMETH
jgi:glycosyltransferase involved in cell wall biosynthesis